MTPELADQLEFVDTQDLVTYLVSRFDRALFVGTSSAISGHYQEARVYHPRGTYVDIMGLIQYAKDTTQRNEFAHPTEEEEDG